MQTWTALNIEVPAGATGQIRTTCPQCSPERRKAKEKCLAVDTSKGVFFCHHCGWAGGLKGESPDEIRRVYKKPKYSKPSELPPEIIRWFQKRGISESILTANQIGYGPSFGKKPGIQFPYRKDGRVVNVKHRSLDKQFRQEKGAEKCLYRVDEISKLKGNTLVISEGEVDALSIQAVGIDMVCSIPDGAPSADAKSYTSKFDFLKSAEPIFDHYRNMILCMDADAPGRVAEREIARRLGVEKCFRVEYPAGSKDANDVLVRHGKEALKTVIGNAKPYPVDGLYSPSDYADDVLILYEHGENRGLPTGWKSLDPLYSVKPGEMTVITGIPGSGKSNLVEALAVNLTAHDWRFVFFSPENWPVERHLQSLLEKVKKAPFRKHGHKNERMSVVDVKDGLAIMDGRFFFIVPKESPLSVDVILEKARVAIFRHGVRGVIIDPWNEIEHAYEGLTEAQYLSRELSKIRRFARMNQVHVWVVAHPRNLIKDKDGNYRPPTMYEISGGAHWRNKADNGICIHRPDYSVDLTEVYIQKIRFREVGKIGQATLRYCRDSGEYLDPR